MKDIILHILTRFGAEIIESRFSETNASILCRVNEKEEPHWQGFVAETLKRLEKEKGWDAHICKRYMWRDGKLFYAWCLLLAVETVKEWDLLIAALRGEEVQAKPLTQKIPFVAPLPPLPQDQKTKGALGNP